MKFRASSLGYLMTEPRSKSEVLSETAKSYILEAYYGEKYGRSKELVSKYLDKGIELEETSITLLSSVDKKFYVKNGDHFSNEYITGTPDIITSKKVIDIKTSWDFFSFIKHKKETEIDKMYDWQLTGYMWLTGLKEAELCYCLVDSPESAYRWDLQKLGDNYEAIEELLKRHNVSDIPEDERVIRLNLAYDESKIERLKNRCNQANEWLKSIGLE